METMLLFVVVTVCWLLLFPSRLQLVGRTLFVVVVVAVAVVVVVVVAVVVAVVVVVAWGLGVARLWGHLRLWLA